MLVLTGMRHYNYLLTKLFQPYIRRHGQANLQHVLKRDSCEQQKKNRRPSASSMAPRSCQQSSSRTCVLDEEDDVFNNGHPHRDENTSKSSDKQVITGLKKLALSADLLGNEACCNFEHLYTMPNLQTLGMPLQFVSLTSIVSGPSATLLIPLIGWFSDRGSNPVRRKAAAVIGTAAIRLAGVMTVVFANFLQIAVHSGNTSAMTARPERNGGLTDFTTISDDWGVNSTSGWGVNSTSGWGVNSTSRDNVSVGDWMSTALVTTSSVSFNLSEVTTASSRSQQEYVIPLVAWLSMLGFVLTDVGVDSNCAAVKIYALACAPRAQHTSVLTAALFIAAVGGVGTASTGMIDLGSLVAPADEVIKAAAKVGIHGTIILALMLFTTFITIVTGKRFVKTCSNEIGSKVGSEVRDTERDPAQKRRRTNSLLEASGRSLLLSSRSSGSGSEAACLLMDDSRRLVSERLPLMSEVRSPALNEDEVLSTSLALHSSSTSKPGQDGMQSLDSCTRYGTGRAGQPPAQEKISTQTHGQDQVNSRPQVCSGRGSLKANIALLCVCTYLGTAQLLVYSMTISDFVGKAILKGNPLTDADSQDLERYQTGVRLASTGFLIYYVFYFLASAANMHLLKRLGYKCELIAALLSTSASLVVVVVTERMEMFYMLSAVAGVQRHCLLIIPYAVTNDLLQSEADRRKEGGSHQVGLFMSLVASMKSMAYCTVYPWLGPLEDATGLVGVPLMVGTVSGVLSAITFVFIRISAWAAVFLSPRHNEHLHRDEDAAERGNDGGNNGYDETSSDESPALLETPPHG